MKIEQFYMGDWGHYIDDDPYVKNMLRNRCKPYSDTKKPTFFMGCWALDKILKNHTGPAIIIMNSNPRKLHSHLDEVRVRKNIYFISTSAIMSNYLDMLNLSYVEFPWELEDREDWKAIPKGNSIYVYGEGPNTTMYGWPTIKRIIADNFSHHPLICTSHYKSVPNQTPFKYYQPHELESIYKKCFLSIRLTRFDGLSGTVQDLGCKGIKTIWNGGTPSGLNYESEKDIINHIHNEAKTIGTVDDKLSDKVKNFLNMNLKEYDYIFDLKTYALNDTGAASCKAPRLFKRCSVPPIDFQTLVETRNLPPPIGYPSTWIDNCGMRSW